MKIDAIVARPNSVKDVTIGELGMKIQLQFSRKNLRT